MTIEQPSIGIPTDIQKILELQSRWNLIRVANVYDALESLGYSNQCLDLKIRPFTPTKHLAGIAVTIRGIRDPYDYDHLAKSEDHIFHGAPNIPEYLFPGAVVVVDGAGEKVTGKMGEMTAWSFQKSGAKGLVVDGYIRDRLGLDMISDFTVCAIGTSPVESNKRWHAQAINVPILLPGTLSSQVVVQPGDWVIGGDDGVIIVPQGISHEVLKIAEDIETKENGMRTDLAAGMSFEDAYRKWGRA